MSNCDNLDSVVFFVNFGILNFFCRCFKKFKYAHDLTDTIAAASLATKCVIEDFAADNIVYLELRTTPRETPTMSKDEYITAVIDAIEYFCANSKRPVNQLYCLFFLQRIENSAAENIGETNRIDKSS